MFTQIDERRNIIKHEYYLTVNMAEKLKTCIKITIFGNAIKN